MLNNFADTKKYNVAADGAVVLLEVTRTEPVNVEKVYIILSTNDCPLPSYQLN